jgi:hypothetical protein
MSKGKKPEGTATVAEHCKCEGCKLPQSRLSFCEPHYDWFKFGLITREGKKVGDFEKKMGHYEAFVERQKQYKAA